MGMVDDLVTRIVLVGSDQLSAPAGAAAASLQGLGDTATTTGGMVDTASQSMVTAMREAQAAMEQFAAHVDGAMGSSKTALGSFGDSVTAVSASLGKMATTAEATGIKVTGSIREIGASAITTGTEMTAMGVKGVEAEGLIASGAAKAREALTGIFLPLLAGFSIFEAVKHSMNFDDELKKIQNNTGMTTAEMDKIGSASKRLSITTNQSMTTIAQGFEHASNLNYNYADSLRIVTVAAHAATGAGGQTADYVNALGTIMHNSHEPMSRAGKDMNILATAAAHGNVRLSEITGNYAKYGQATSAMHIPLTESLSLYSALTQSTHNAALAQTEGTAIMGAMAKPTKAANDLMVQLKQTTGIDLVDAFHKVSTGQMSLHHAMKLVREATKGNIADDMTLFAGKRGGLGALQLLGNGWTDYGTILDQVTNHQINTEDGFKRMMGSLGGVMGAVRNVADVILTNFGDMITPALTEAAKHLKDFGTFIVDHMSEIRGFFDAVGSVAHGAMTALAAAASWVGTEFQKAWPSIQKFGAFLKTEIASAIQWVRTEFEKAKPYIEQFGSAFGAFMSQHGDSFKSGLKDVGDIIATVAKSLKDAITWVKNFGSEFLHVVTSSKPLHDALTRLWAAFGQIGNAIGSVTGGLGGLDKGHKTSGDSAKSFADTLASVVIPAVINVANIFVKSTPTIVKLIKDIPPAVKLIADAIHEVQPIIMAAMTLIADIFSGKGDKINRDMTRLKDALIPLFTWLGAEMQRLIDEALAYILKRIGDFVAAALEQVKTWAGQVVQWFTDLPGKLAGGLGSLVSTVVKGFANTASGAMSELGKLKDRLGSWISDRVTQFLNAAHSWVASMITGLGDKVGSLISEASKIATAIFDTIKTFFTSHNPFSGLVSQAKDAVGAITGFLGGIGSGISNAVGGKLSAAGGSSHGGGGYTRGDQYGGYGNSTANYLSSGDANMLGSMGVNYSGGLMDTDFATGSGHSQAFRLPPGGSYQLEKQGTDANVGGYEVWKNKINGGVEMFLHALRESGLKVGSTVAGGTTVGMSGHALTTAYGNDPSFWHLCVVNDAGQREWLSGAQMTAASARGAHAGGGGALAARQRGGTWSPTPHILGGEHNLPGVRSDYAFSMPRGGEHYAGGVQTDYNTAQRNQYMGGFIGTNTSAGALGALAAQSPQHKYGSFGAAQADTGNLSASIVKLTGSLDKLSPEVAKTMKAAIVAEAAQMQGYTSTYNTNYAAENSRHVAAVAKIYHDNASQTVKQEGIYHAQIAANNQAAITSTAAAHEKYLKARGKINDRFQTAQINEGTSLQTARNNADRAQTQALARLSQTEGKRQENSNSALSKANTAANEKAAEDRRKETDRYNGILKDHGSATASQLRSHTARLKAITDTHSDKLATNLEKHPVKMAAVTGTHITAFDRITQHHKNAFDNAARAHVVSFGKATRQHTLQMGYLTQAHVKDYGAANEKLSKANDKWLIAHKAVLAGHLDSEGKGFDKHIAGLKSGLTAHLNGLSAANAALVAKMREALTDHALWDGLAAHLSNVIGKGTKDLAYQILKGTADQTHGVRPGGMNTDGGTGNTITQIANNAPLMASLADSIRKQKAMTDAMTDATARAAAAAGDFGKSLAATTALLAGKVNDALNKFIYDSLHPKGGPGGKGGGTGALTGDLAKYDAMFAKQQANIAKTTAAQDAADRSVGKFDSSLTTLANTTSGPAKLAMTAFTYGMLTSTGDAKALGASMVSTAQADKAAAERTNQAHLESDRLLGNFGTSLADSQKKVSEAYTTASNAFLYDSTLQSGATQQDISDLIASSQALKAHNESVTANIDSQNRITGSYTSSVATFTAQINGPLAEANAKYAYDLHNHTGDLGADSAAIQTATVGVRALGEEAQKVAFAALGVYDGFVASAKAAYDHARAAFLDAQQSGVTGDALQGLHDKAIDLGVAFDHAGDAATNFDTEMKTAADGIKQTAKQLKTQSAGPNLYQWAAGNGPNAAMQGGGAGVGATGTGIIGSSGTNFASSTGLPLGTSMATAQAGTNYSGFAQSGLGYPTAPLTAGKLNVPVTGNNYNVPVVGTNTGTMPGGPTGTSGTITGVPYINGPSAPSGTVYYDPATKLFVPNGGWLSIDMLNNNSSVNNGSGGSYQNPNLPVGAYMSTTNYLSGDTPSGGLGPGGLPMGAWGQSSSASAANLGSASGSIGPPVISPITTARLNQLKLRTQPIGGSTSGYVGPSTGTAGASPSNPVYVTPTSMSASQTTAMQAQLTQLQAQTTAAQTASNAQIAALQAANALQAEQLAHAIQDTLTLKELQRQNTEALNLSTHTGTASTSTAQLMDMAALQNRGAT